jgi:hypothetical protein
MRLLPVPRAAAGPPQALYDSLESFKIAQFFFAEFRFALTHINIP